MYTVIVSFRDLQDNCYRYQVGDTFPHKGLSVSDERIDELLTDKNRRHKPMIKAVDVPSSKEEPETVTEAVTETVTGATPEVETEEKPEVKTEEKPKRKGRKKTNVE